MSSPATSLVRVVGLSQQYEWGKLGSASAVAQLQAAGANAAIDAAKPYAELWMGTHPSGPSAVRLADGSTKPLRDHLGADLPFLFKVLSVGKALSIQAHPDMTLARQLHAERPGVYKDPFHKPELACAITPFEALCAFRPIEQIQANASAHPEFAALMGEENVKRLAGVSSLSPDEQKSVLKSIFSSMMTPTADALKTQLVAMLARFDAEGVKASVPAADKQSAAAASADSAIGASLDIPSLIVRLSQQYPGDVGIFAPFFLNAFALHPGQAIFLGPNEPHAYLAGDCVECMACSDNVVRAGLTPKLRDTDVLISMLTYATHTVSSTLMTPTAVTGADAAYSTQFAPPKEFSEFRLIKTVLPTGAKTTLTPTAGASIIIAYGEGAGQISLESGGETLQLANGTILLVPDGAKAVVQSTGAKDLALFRCAANAS